MAIHPTALQNKPITLALLRIGITGNMGSGKTTVCQIFEQLGIPVYNADSEAKKLYLTHVGLKRGVLELLGDSAYFTDGSLNREWIKEAIFSDNAKREALNKLVHPLLLEEFNAWCIQKNDGKTPYILKEAAILFESGSYRDLDFVIGVLAPKPLILERIMHRDSISARETSKRLKAQWPDKKWQALCKYTILNDGKAPLIKQVLKTHKSIVLGQQ